MEQAPLVESMEVKWIKYGKMLVLLELLQTARLDWTGYGTRLWAENQVKALQDEL